MAACKAGAPASGTNSAILASYFCRSDPFVLPCLSRRWRVTSGGADNRPLGRRSRPFGRRNRPRGQRNRPWVVGAANGVGEGWQFFMGNGRAEILQAGKPRKHCTSAGRGEMGADFSYPWVESPIGLQQQPHTTLSEPNRARNNLANCSVPPAQFLGASNHDYDFPRCYRPEITKTNYSVNMS